jgi:hypothetical protein
MEHFEERRLLARQVSGFIQAPDTWSGTIHVTGDVTVTTQLTIQPGTIVKIAQGQNINIRTDGSLNAMGTVTSPIIFTSVQDDSVGEDLTGLTVGVPQKGHWHTLMVQSSNATLEHFEVRYAGNDSNPGHPHQPFRVGSIIVGPGTPTLRNGLVRDGDWTGIDVTANATLDSIRVETMTSSAFYQRDNLNPTYANLSAANNGGNHVLVDGGQLIGTRSWSFGGLPAHLTKDQSPSRSLCPRKGWAHQGTWHSPATNHLYKCP